MLVLRGVLGGGALRVVLFRVVLSGGALQGCLGGASGGCLGLSGVIQWGSYSSVNTVTSTG